MKPSRVDPSKKYGRLIIRSLFRKDWILFARVTCDCGAKKTVRVKHLLSGATSSCGCYAREQSLKGTLARKTHRHTVYRGVKHQRSPTYQSWSSAKERCYRPKGCNYHRYGGRGITMCNRWRYSFDNFLHDMGERPPGKTLERKLRNGNYTKSNCIWATPKEQGRNKENNRLVNFFGVTIPVIEVAEKTSIPYGMLHLRLARNNWSVTRALDELETEFAGLCH